MLVGGGELHDTFDSLVRTERPLARGIQRFTGITQAMVDAAPPATRGARGAGRPARGPRARGPQRPLRPRRAAPGVRALRARLAAAAGDLHRPDGAPLRAAGAKARAGVAGQLARHRRGRGPPRPARRAHVRARVLCALPAALRQRRERGRRARAGEHPSPLRKTEPAERIPPSERPDLSTLPDDPGVYIFRDERGTPVYVGKSVSLRSRARAHFCAPAGWTEKAEIVDYRPTNSELGALVLENRLIKSWRPSGNKKLKRTDRYCYLRCRLDIAYPVLEVAAEPAPGNAVNVGPLGSRALASELADQLTSLYRLRHCGRSLRAARAPLGLWADGPLRLALPRRPRPERLPAPARPRAGALRAAGRGHRADRRAGPAHGRGVGRAPLRARRGAAAPARAARLGARAAGGRAARHPRRAPAGARAPSRQGALRRLLAGPRPARRTGGRCPARRSSRSGPNGRSTTRPAATWSPRTRSTRCASWPAGLPTTSLPSWPSTRRRAPPQLLRFVSAASAARGAPARAFARRDSR